MQIRRLLAAAVAVVLAQASWAAGDDLPASSHTLHAGDRVRFRITAGAAMTMARVLEVDGESLVFETTKDNRRLRVDPLTLARLDVAHGKRSRAGLGAVIGASAGVAFGGFVGHVAASIDEVETTHPAEGLLVGAAIVGGAGALLGAVIGSAFRTDRWEQVRDRRVQLAVGPAPGRGLAGAVTVRF